MPFVGRGHDPADQVAHFALTQFNGSAFITLRFGGVMTPPYEVINNGFMYYGLVWEKWDVKISQSAQSGRMFTFTPIFFLRYVL